MSKKDKPVRVKLIFNPAAGIAADASKNLKLAVGCLEQHGLKVETAKARPKEEATQIARQAVKDGFKIVIAMGGDGTVEAVMRGMIGKKARLGIIPAGINNLIAKSLGIPLGLEEACTLIASEHTLKLDLGQATTKKGDEFIFFETATIGLSAKSAQEFNKVSGGKFSGFNLAGLAFSHQAARPKVFLTLDDESEIEIGSTLVTVSNPPAFEKTDTAQDALLDVSVYPDFGKEELLRYYAALMNGGYSGDGKVQHYQARKVKVKSSPRMDLIADGVTLGKGTVTIKIRADALRIITAEQRSGLSAEQDISEEKFSPDPVSDPLEKDQPVNDDVPADED